MDPVSGFFSVDEESRTLVPDSLELLSERQGGWCQIWRGNRHGRFRVWKCLREEYRGQTLYEEMLRKEFRIGYSLRHNNIVEYYDYLPIPSLGNCIEMEWIDGSPLLCTPAPDRLKIALQIIDALEYLHARQVIHKDIKPSNILITHNGRNVKLIDFGLSDADDTPLKLKAGTDGFAAPELKESGICGAAADIYSLGRVLEKMGYGKIARRCTAADPEKRPSLEQVRKSLQCRFPWGWLFGVIGLASALTVLLLLPHQETPIIETVPKPDTVITVIDTLVVEKQVDTPHKPSSKGAKTETRPKQEEVPAQADEKTLEEIFKEATELF